jgi:hypothetical protein
LWLFCKWQAEFSALAQEEIGQDMQATLNTQSSQESQVTEVQASVTAVGNRKNNNRRLRSMVHQHFIDKNDRKFCKYCTSSFKKTKDGSTSALPAPLRRCMPEYEQQDPESAKPISADEFRNLQLPMLYSTMF